MLSATWDTPGKNQYYGTGYVQLLINQGAGKFKDETATRYPAQIAETPGPWWKFIRVADFNLDGAPDLLLTGAGPRTFDDNQSAKLLLNDGNGIFTEGYVLPYSASSGAKGISDVTTQADVNGDGYPDLVTAEWSSTTSLVLKAYLNDFQPQAISGGSTDDSLSGGVGNDSLTGGAGNDTLNGGLGNDTAVFTGMKASYSITSKTDGSILVSGSDGTDTLSNIEKLQFADGEMSLSVLTSTEEDPISGGSGNDKLNGTTGSDAIFGLAGNDQLNGGSGDDRLFGGEGIDKLSGGTGADTFVFDNFSTSGASAADKIADFKVSEGDTFSFDTSVFTSLVGGISAGNVVIGAKVKLLDADDYLIFITKGGKLYYDADGSASGAAVQLAGVKGSFSSIDYTSFEIE